MVIKGEFVRFELYFERNILRRSRVTVYKSNRVIILYVIT